MTVKLKTAVGSTPKKDSIIFNIPWKSNRIEWLQTKYKYTLQTIQIQKNVVFTYTDTSTDTVYGIEVE